jgi:DNA invertase Pin-like site-specific DNA recombinase
VEQFAHDHGLVIAATYIENESGAKLARPELLRLLADSKPGDILLVEAVDRLSRLTASDWQTLRTTLTAQRKGAGTDQTLSSLSAAGSAF